MSTRDRDRFRLPAFAGAPPRVLVVRAPYYQAVVDALGAGALRVLEAAGARHAVCDVAGAFELPGAIRLARAAGAGFDGYVALGCVVRGETSHYDHICDATMHGFMRLAVADGVALGTGLLTVETVAQAEARAQGPGGDNKGEEAALACLGQIAVARRFAATAAGPVLADAS